MNRLDKMIMTVRSSNRFTYYLVYTTIPQDDGKIHFSMSLNKSGKAIAIINRKTFDNEDELKAFIDKLYKKYNLTESNTEVMHFQIVSATEEDAREAGEYDEVI